MPRGQRSSTDLDSRAYAYLELSVNEPLELTYLRAGRDPDIERPHRDGQDITDQPENWTAYQRARRIAYEARVDRYRARGLVQRGCTLDRYVRFYEVSSLRFDEHDPRRPPRNDWTRMWKLRQLVRHDTAAS